MPTLKKRVNLTVDAEMFEALEVIAKRRRKSLSAVSIDLIKQALEMYEDFYFSEVSEKRLSEETKRLSGEVFWTT